MGRPCNCSGGGIPFPDAPSGLTTYSRPDGTWSLWFYPDCTGGHHGRFDGLTIYVVARNTPLERMFAYGDFADAADYLNSIRDDPKLNGTVAQIDPLPTSGLCDAAVIEVYG